MRLNMTASTFILILVLLLLAFLVIADSKETPIIVGSSVDVYCPLDGGTPTFDVPSEKDTSELDIVRGHLHIPEVRFEHNGTISCYVGGRRALAKLIVVIRDPERYKAEVSFEPFFQGSHFRVYCHLRIPNGTEAYVRFLLDGKPFAFTDFRVDSTNPSIRHFWLDRKLPVTLRDAGRTVQCEVRVPFGEPCCPRSKKRRITVEDPLQFVHNMTNKVVQPGQTLTLTFLVKHLRHFNGSEISVLNPTRAKVALIENPKIKQIERHLSNVTLSFKPQMGIHYISLDQLLSVPFFIQFEYEKAPKWMVVMLVILTLIALVLAALVILLCCCCWRKNHELKVTCKFNFSKLRQKLTPFRSQKDTENPRDAEEEPMKPQV